MTKLSKRPTGNDQLSIHAKAAREELEKVSVPGCALTMLVSQDNQQHELKLPAEAVAMLMQVLENLALHKSVSVVASDKLLTTQHVADILRVSRPFVTKLIDRDKLPCRMVGSHRRIRFDDLMQYKETIDLERRKVLDKLSEQAQELDMGY